jgi:hypothetical protein
MEVLGMVKSLCYLVGHVCNVTFFNPEGMTYFGRLNTPLLEVGHICNVTVLQSQSYGYNVAVTLQA